MGRQSGAGGELEAVWDVSPALRLTGNVAWQHATDLATNTDSDSDFSRHQYAFVRSDWRFTPGWQLSAQVNSVMDRVRASSDTRAALPDYTSTDLTLRTSVNRQREIAGSVRSVFNATVMEPSAASTVPSDLPQAGRSWYVQDTYRL